MKSVIHFTRIRVVTYILSAVIVVGMFVFTFVQGGFNLGVDFQPGLSTQISVTTPGTTIDKVRSAVAGIEGAQVQSVGAADRQSFTIRVRLDSKDAGDLNIPKNKVDSAMTAAFGKGNYVVDFSNTIGPKVSASLTNQAFLLVGIALVVIFIYIVIRFRVGFAVGAMVSTIHDTLFMIGFIGLVQMEVTTATIAAVLTIIGYSLNDTIVVFDRIRENDKTMADQKLSLVVDTSITQTMSRTIVTSGTTLIAVLAIAIFAQGEIRNFAIALIVGILIGTYSSIFMAAPVLMEYRNAEIKRRLRREAKLAGKPKDAIEAALEGEQTSSADHPDEVDAEAIAESLRRERSEKKKF